MSQARVPKLPRGGMRPDLFVIGLFAFLAISFAVARAAPAVEPAQPPAPLELEGVASDPVVHVRPTYRLARELAGPRKLSGCMPMALSVLVGEEELWLGVTTGDRRRFPAVDGAHDWGGLAEALEEMRGRPSFEWRWDAELGATDEVTYSTLLRARAVLVEAGFDDVRFSSPRYLASRLGPADD